MSGADGWGGDSGVPGWTIFVGGEVIPVVERAWAFDPFANDEATFPPGVGLAGGGAFGEFTWGGLGASAATAGKETASTTAAGEVPGFLVCPSGWGSLDQSPSAWLAVWSVWRPVLGSPRSPFVVGALGESSWGLGV